MFDNQQLNKLHQYAYSLTKNKDDAYDLLYTCLERYLRQGSEKQEPMAYLKRSIKNAFIDKIKSSAYQREVLFEDTLSTSSNTQNEMGDSTMDKLVGLDTQCLEDIIINEQEVGEFTNRLTSEENELLYYWAVEGYTVQELSDETGKPKGTLLSRLHRIRKKAESFTSKAKLYRIGS